MAINLEMLQEKAKDVRIDIIRQIHSAGSGHPGGSLSAADIITYLYFAEMNIDPQDPHKAGRDRFVLSKGHAAPALYAALAEKGYFPKETLLTLRQADKIDENGARVYSVLGDGELQEGMVWEAAMAAAHYGLSNLTIFVDHNGLQIDGRNEDVITVAPIAEKFESFGWDVQKIDGHDFEQIAAAVENAKAVSDKPQAIIAETIKGKGVSFMENEAGWHGKAPNDEQAEQAVTELGGEW